MKRKRHKTHEIHLCTDDDDGNGLMVSDDPSEIK